MSEKVKRDYYRVLGVRPIDGEPEIKKAYKDLAKKFHPDLNPTMRTWAEDKMKELTEAYEVLLDSEKRREYDTSTMFQSKVPKFIDANTKAVKTGPYFLEEKKPSFIDKIKKLMFVETEVPVRDKMTQKTAEHFAMGLSYLDKRKDKMLEMAKMEFEIVIKEAPDNPEALYNMGIVEYLLGNFQSALDHFARAKHRMKNTADASKMIEMLKEE